MESINAHADAGRRRRRSPLRADGAFHPASPPGAHPSLGYVETPLPAGSRRLGPVQRGDQGISRSERPHAERAISRLFEARGVDMVAMYDQETGTYELRSRSGWIRWERWTTPTGELRYRVVAQQGENPIPNVDGTVLRTLEAEAAAAGGVGKPVPKERNSYPDMLGRITQLFDHARAPEFVYIPDPGGDPNHPGTGSHGIPDMIQSRSPLVIAGPGIARGAVSDALVRHEDIAPTVAQLVGVRPVAGTNASGVRRMQLLRWQDGKSLAPAIADARIGAGITGAAQRAIVFTIDGMGHNALFDEIRKGTLPNFARIMAAGTVFRNGSLAQYPTVTWANHNTIVTGASPGHNGLVNNSWWDRSTQREQFITDGGFRNSLRTGRFMDPEVETLYEAVERSFPDARTMAVNQPSGRGADLSVLDLKGLTSLIPSLPRLVLSTLRHTRQAAKDMMADGEWKKQTIQDAFAAAVGETFWAKADPPKLGVFEFTLSDNQGHHKGPHHPHARRALQQIDQQVGAVLDTLERRGIAGSTAIVLTADHGMAHQYTDKRKLGGWFKALDRAAADGARTVESTRFVYVRSVQWGVEGAVPAAGTSGTLTIRVANDDEDASGTRPAIPGATVTVRDAAGGTWTAVTDTEGRVRLPITPTRGPLSVTVEHVDYSVERGTIALPDAPRGATGRRRPA